MSEFDFQFGSTFTDMLSFQIGFSSEVEIVNSWTTDGFLYSPPVFTPIPSGPVLIRSIGVSAYGSTFKIAESDDPILVAQFVVERGMFSRAGLSIRTISVPAGSEYKAFHTLRGPFVAINAESGTDDFLLQALGIPERAPASMRRDPNPPFVPRGV